MTTREDIEHEVDAAVERALATDEPFAIKAVAREVIAAHGAAPDAFHEAGALSFVTRLVVGALRVRGFVDADAASEKMLSVLDGEALRRWVETRRKYGKPE